MSTVATALVAAVALACPALAAADSTETEGIAVKPITTSPWEALLYWTPRRLANAEPLSVIAVPGSPPEEAPASPTASPNEEPTASPNEEPTASPTEEPTASPTEAPTESPIAAPTAAPTGATTAAVGAPATAVEGVEVAATESTVFPNSVNGKVFGAFEIKGELHSYECSGSVVASRHGDVVLTAGHCAIDRETGTVAKYLIFIPGYREGDAPYGLWTASLVVITESWEKTAKRGSTANEGGDIALLTIRENNESESLEEVVGASLGIAFDQPCEQIYTQYGYPAEPPYSGEILYSHSTPYAGVDTNLFFSPEPMKIATDFTPGSSGGPWTVGPSTAPTVLSLTAYGYETQPGYLYGPYFGEVARKAYAFASGETVPAGIEATCTAPPPPLPPAEPPRSQPSPTPVQPQPSTPAAVRLKVKRVHRRADGSAIVVTKVGSAGKLELSGAAVRADSLITPAAGNYKLTVAAKGGANRRLKHRGRAKVGVKIAFRAAGKIRRVTRSIQLSRRTAIRHSTQHARRPR